MSDGVDAMAWEVPRCWPGETVAVLGGGASITQDQADRCRGRCRVVAINRAGLPAPRGVRRWVAAPWADCLYGSDLDRFWRWHPEAAAFSGLKLACFHPAAIPSTATLAREAMRAGVRLLLREAGDGIASPGAVRGNNSLAQVLSFLPRTGVARIVLLGCDMTGRRWHHGYPDGVRPDYTRVMLPGFAPLAAALADAGIAVANCSPGTVLPYFDPVHLEDALP